MKDSGSRAAIGGSAPLSALYLSLVFCQTRKKDVYKVKPLTEGKKNIISALLEEYDIEDWQTRPLAEISPVLYIDAVQFSVREDNRIKKLADYVIPEPTQLATV